MVLAQIDSGTRGDVAASVDLYADTVDFLDEGTKTREAIAQDLPAYFAHWPVRRSQLVGDVDIQTVGENERKVEYTLDFEASNPATNESRRSRVVVTWIIRRESALSPFKIVSHKQRRVAEENPTASSSIPPATDPTIEIVRSYITALNNHDAAAAYRHFSAAYRSKVSFNSYSPRVRKTGTITIDSIARSASSGTSATIELTFREQEPARTIHWHGNITVVLDSGQWRIDSLSGLQSDR
jgi:hypothetical protein